MAGRKPRHVDQLIATEDHNTPTVDIDRPNPDETSALQLTTLEKNCKEFGVRLHPLGDADQASSTRSPRFWPDPAGHDHRVR